MTVFLSGCTTPGTDFDVVKVVATVTRNGGDYTITPTGESGYEMHVVVGTLSVQALEMDIDSQAIKSLYKINDKDRIQYYRNINDGGVLGRIKGWWQRTEGASSIKFNSVSDLELAQNGQFGFTLPTISEIGNINYLGQAVESFDLTNNSLRIPNYGLGIYSAVIPEECFKPNGVEPGYLVLNDPTKEHLNGITVTVDGVVSHKNTAFVIYDGEYKVVVLTNEPATLQDDDMKTIKVSLQLIKPTSDVIKLSDTYYNSADDYYTAYGYGMKQQLTSGTANLIANVETAVESALQKTLDAIPGSSILKSFDSVSEFFDGSEVPSISESIENSFFMESMKTAYDKKSTVYATTWNIFSQQVNGMGHPGFLIIGSDTVNINDGMNSHEWDLVEKAFFGYDRMWPFPHVDPIFDESQRLQLIRQMQADSDAWVNSHGLDDFYNTWKLASNVVSFSGPVFAVQIVDDSFIGIFDTKTMNAMKSLLDLEWNEELPSVTMEDLDNFRADLQSSVEATIQEIIPQYIGTAMSGIEENLTDLNRAIEELNSVVLELQLQMKDVQNYLKTLIPTTPAVSIFAYQVPTPVYSKILGPTGDFIQADPTTSFSAACTVSIGDTTNWTLSAGYPRAIIITESDGTLTIPLQADTFGTYVLRQDMIGEDNLTVGDTVKTYFEAQVTNGTDTLTSRTGVYYTRVVRSWLADAVTGLGIVIDDLTASNDELQAAINFLTSQNSPFSGGNQTNMDSFFATLSVKDSAGEDLYVLSPKKNFKMGPEDSEVLIWEVTIFQDKPYTISIVLGNSTTDVLVRYSTSINKADAKWYSPSTWWAKMKDFVEPD